MFTPGVILKHDLSKFRYPVLRSSNTSGKPEHEDYRAEMLKTDNQGASSMCAAYAMAGCIEWWNWKQYDLVKQIDPKPIYETAKRLDGFPDEEGTTLEAVVRAAFELDLMDIDIASLQVVRLEDVKRALHKHGPMLSAFTIHEGWQKAAADGWIQDSGDVLGGHAVVLTGYSTVELPNYFSLQNSWGDAMYGWKGFARMAPAQFAKEFAYGLVWEVAR
jgi:hypothetical protein